VRARRHPGVALVRFLVPYAAGALTVLALDRPAVERTHEPVAAPLSFAAIADRTPPPPPPVVLPSAPAPSEDALAFAPVPRIS
jgi:hypothetical protein